MALVTLKAEGPLSMTSPSKHHVLVVDDEPSVRETTAMLLNNAGYDVSTAEHGFDVDVYDPQLPTVTLPASPFLSLETLREYAAERSWETVTAPLLAWCAGARVDENRLPFPTPPEPRLWQRLTRRVLP